MQADLLVFILSILSFLPFIGMAWTDSVSTKSVGLLTLSVSDTTNNWSDAVSKTATGSVGLSDSLALSDATSLQAQGRKAVSDDANNLSDAVTTDLSVSFNQSLSDSFTLADFTPVVGFQYQATANDSFSLTDAVSTQVAIGLTASDNLANWNDGVVVSQQLRISDSFTGWADFVVTFPRAPLAIEAEERLRLADFDPAIGLDYQILANDSFLFSDTTNQQAASYLVSADSANNWDDSVAYDLTILSGPLTVAADDSANNWTDSIQQLLDGQLAIEDSVANWNDASSTVSHGSFSIADSLPVQSDSESHIVIHRLIIADTLPGFADAAQSQVGGFVVASDVFVLSDATSLVGLQNVESEDDAGYAVDDVDTFVSSGSQHNLIITDVLPAQADNIDLVSQSTAFSVGDSFTLTDSVTIDRGTQALPIAVGGVAVLPPLIEPTETGIAVLPDLIGQPGIAVAVIAAPPTDTGHGVAVLPDLPAAIHGLGIVAEPIEASGSGVGILPDPVPAPGLATSFVGD